VKATRSFEEQVLRKRPYLSYEMCEDGETIHNAFVDRSFRKDEAP
jgi:hypothetical protein